MPKINYVTKENSSPRGKARVYFTCHPSDLETSLKTICEDIFAAQD